MVKIWREAADASFVDGDAFIRKDSFHCILLHLELIPLLATSSMTYEP